MLEGLKEAGLDDFAIYEKADRLGGTWRDNQYPGACCDVPSHLYCFSYEPNPDWTRRFAPAREIHAYQRHVMHAYDLCDRCRGGFDVASARWDGGGWTVTSRQGESLRARYLVSAVGALHLPGDSGLIALLREQGYAVTPLPLPFLAPEHRREADDDGDHPESDAP